MKIDILVLLTSVIGLSVAAGFRNGGYSIGYGRGVYNTGYGGYAGQKHGTNNMALYVPYPVELPIQIGDEQENNENMYWWLLIGILALPFLLSTVN